MEDSFISVKEERFLKIRELLKEICLWDDKEKRFLGINNSVNVERGRVNTYVIYSKEDILYYLVFSNDNFTYKLTVIDTDIFKYFEEKSVEISKDDISSLLIYTVNDYFYVLYKKDYRIVRVFVTVNLKEKKNSVVTVTSLNTNFSLIKFYKNYLFTFSMKYLFLKYDFLTGKRTSILFHPEPNPNLVLKSFHLVFKTDIFLNDKSVFYVLDENTILYDSYGLYSWRLYDSLNDRNIFTSLTIININTGKCKTIRTNKVLSLSEEIKKQVIEQREINSDDLYFHVYCKYPELEHFINYHDYKGINVIGNELIRWSDKTNMYLKNRRLRELIFLFMCCNERSKKNKLFPFLPMPCVLLFCFFLVYSLNF